METPMERNRGHQYFPPNGNTSVADSVGDMMGDDMGAKNLGAENQEGVMEGDSGARDQADSHGNVHISSSGISAIDLTGKDR
jgi:hypothetical protein